MIGVKIMGGLGNQLFQYAAAVTLAEKHNTEIALDLSWYEDQSRPWWQPYMLELPEGDTEGLTLRTEDADLLDLPDGTLLYGYWQKPEYVPNGFELPFAPPTVPPFQDGTVGVHVRRGAAKDYAGPYPADPHHPTLSPAYYQRAQNLLPTDSPTVVFSDDPNLSAYGFGGILYGGEPLQDFAAMTKCDHLVVANSTFSWWAARLNKRDGIIVRPDDGSAIWPQGWLAA